MQSSANDLVVSKTVDFVKEKLHAESSGHDWWHVYRVCQLAKRIGQAEDVNMYIVELAALLHDIADWKFHNGDESIGPRVASDWLRSCGVDEDEIDRVAIIIREISFKGSGEDIRPSTKEGMVVQDADRLDAIGAIGIARAFAYGGYKGRAMHEPNISPKSELTADEYKANTSPTINHFYEKLLLLKDRMNTNTARELAEARHTVMQTFLQEFFEEWEGRA